MSRYAIPKAEQLDSLATTLAGQAEAIEKLRLTTWPHGSNLPYLQACLMVAAAALREAAQHATKATTA